MPLTASCSSCHFATSKFVGSPFSFPYFFPLFFLFFPLSCSPSFPAFIFQILHCRRWVYCVSYQVSNQALEVDDRIVLIYWSLGNQTIPSGHRIMKNNALTYLSKMPGVGEWFTRMGGLWHTWFTCVHIALICCCCWGWGWGWWWINDTDSVREETLLTRKTSPHRYDSDEEAFNWLLTTTPELCTTFTLHRALMAGWACITESLWTLAYVPLHDVIYCYSEAASSSLLQQLSHLCIHVFCYLFALISAYFYFCCR